MNPTKSGLIAQAAHSATTGAVVYWTLSGAADRAALAAAWAAAGLDSAWLPAPASPADALRRACKALESPAVLVRKHPKGGWQAVAESKAGGKLEYSAGVRFYLDDQAVPQAEPAEAPEAARIAGAFAGAMATLAAPDASSWLVRIMARLGAVLLRETGGIYFVPNGAIAQFHAIKGAAGAVGTVYEIPATHSAEVVQAVVAALQREVAETIAELEHDIDAEEIRGETLAGRAARCNAAIAKVADFERLLGAPAGDAIARLEDLKARISAACKRKLSRFDNLEIDAPLTDAEIAAIKADAADRAAKRAAAKAAREVKASAPVPAARTHRIEVAKPAAPQCTCVQAPAGFPHAFDCALAGAPAGDSSDTHDEAEPAVSRFAGLEVD